MRELLCRNCPATKTLRDLALIIPLPHDFVDRWDCEISPEDWEIEDNRLVLDLAKIKGREGNEDC